MRNPAGSPAVRRSAATMARTTRDQAAIRAGLGEPMRLMAKPSARVRIRRAAPAHATRGSDGMYAVISSRTCAEMAHESGAIDQDEAGEESDQGGLGRHED